MSSPRAASEESQPGPHGAEQRIATAILDLLETTGGRLIDIDVLALKAQFVGHEASVDAQVARIRLQSDHQGTLGLFKIIRKIGSGSSGEVLEAVDSRLGRRVALKVLRESTSLAIEREGRALASLDHPNIARIHAIEEAQGLRFMVMELVDGASLEAIVKACRDWPDDRPVPEGGLGIQQLLLEAVAGRAEESKAQAEEGTRGAAATKLLGGTYFRELATAMAWACDALQFAHERGLVHRDVKPGNLLLDRTGRVKVTDFGLAKHEHLLRLSRTGVFVGTPFYASPEQTSGRRRVGPPSDIWSIGATLYELITLEVPFPGESEEDVFRGILGGRYARPRELNPRIPSDLERIIVRCLERHPEFRYAAARDVAADLRGFAANEALGSRPVGWMRRIAAGIRHPTRRGLVAGVLTTVLLGTIAGALLLSEFRRIRDRDDRCQERLKDAWAAFREGAERRDPEMLRRAIALAGEAVDLRPVAAQVRQAELIVRGLVAYEETNDAEAARLLGDARKLGPLEQPYVLALARAQFGANRAPDARSTYGSIQGSANDPPIVREMKLVDAYIDARELKFPILRCVSAAGLQGVEAKAALAIADVADPGQSTEASPRRVLHFYPEGLRGRSSEWVVQTNAEPDRPGAVLVADVTDDPGAEVLVLGTRAIYVGIAPFADLGPAKWIEVSDPVQVSCETNLSRAPGDDFATETNLHLAAFRNQDGTAVVYASRYEGIGSLTLDHGAATRPTCAPAWATGSQAHILKRIELMDGPALVIGLAEHYSFTVSVARPSSADTFSRIGWATLGAPQDAIALRVAGKDLLVVAVGGGANDTGPKFLGKKSPAGWDYGIYAFRTPTALNELIPQAGIGFPRPLVSEAGLHAVDLVDDDQPEVLFREAITVENGTQALNRTHVIGADAGGMLRLQQRLRLPGAVTAALCHASGDVDLVVDFEGKKTHIVSTRR